MLWSVALADLDPAFRAKLEPVLAGLEARGYTPVVSTTWRGDAVQDVLAATGASNATAGKSCHNRVAPDGSPAARAADVWSRPMDLALFAGLSWRLEVEAPFLRVLGELAHRHGLRWGGDWRGRASAWDTYGLGWDPAHVELPPCG
ncbi:MAG: hypothetical protein ACOZNI_31235 [Myxococcota bacterium]